MQIQILNTTLMLVVYHRDPDEMPANAGTNANIDSGIAAQLRTVIRNTCYALPRTGLA